MNTYWYEYRNILENTCILDNKFQCKSCGQYTKHLDIFVQEYSISNTDALWLTLSYAPSHLMKYTTFASSRSSKS